MARTFKHVAIVGPGAIGCLLAVRLAAAQGGPKVTLIDHKPARALRLRARPIVIHTPSGDLRAQVDVALLPRQPPDLVILATKAYAARQAAESAGVWSGGAPVIAFQNGLGVAEEVAAAAPGAAVITAVSYQAANLLGEGEVNHVANLETHFGYEGRAPDGAVAAVAELFTRAGLPAKVAPDMTPLVWGKLLVNAAINPVAALAGVTNGAVAGRPALRALAQALAEEGEAVARARGVALRGPGAPSEGWSGGCAGAAEAALETAGKTADNRCSMLQDLEAGRPTEIDYLNGAIVRVAESLGIAVPVNRAITALVRQVSPIFDSW